MLDSFKVEEADPVTNAQQAKSGAPGKMAAAGGRLIEVAISATAFFVLWELVIRTFSVPAYIFPAPSAILVTLWNGALSGAYTAAVITTSSEILAGLIIGAALGIGLGTALVVMPRLDRVIYPYIVASQTVPKVAIAPLFIIWFGFGLESKIIIVALTCLFPLLVNTIAGMKATEAERVMLVRALCGSPAQLLWYVKLPSALPYIFAGFHTAVILAVIGAIVGEFVGARRGIGVMILQANFNLDLAAVFALLLILALLGVLLSACVSVLEKKVCFWSSRSAR